MPDKPTAIFVLREEAEQIGRRLSTTLGADLLLAYQHEEKPRDQFVRQFADYSAWVLVMATGIAVRFLSGLPGDKHTDPAVVVLDEGCHHAIALLAGHEGGANQLAFTVANIIQATPVVSTATEARKPLVVGLGCRKGTSTEQISTAIHTALSGRSFEEVRCIATVAAKKDEPGLLEFCRTHDIPLRVFEHADVGARGWVTRPSEWVKETLGLDGVCEPCALMATPRGKLITPKLAVNGVAVAIVEDSARIDV